MVFSLLDFNVFGVWLFSVSCLRVLCLVSVSSVLRCKLKVARFRVASCFGVESV